MSITTETLSNYLGRQASALLADTPFKHWNVTRSVETDLGRPVIDYIFPQDGMDFVCDEVDKVKTIFVYYDASRLFHEGISDLPSSLDRKQVIARLGSPSKSGPRMKDSILGECGAWDRFTRSGYSIHVEYRMDVDLIKMVTLMRLDVVP
jgi:hypothetical protein